MASKFQAPRGTSDALPADARARARVEAAAAAICARAGYEPIATPIFEDTELFERGVGRSTDIVRKEMFTFEDKGGRSVTLRPEGTAPICRAYLEHGMQKLAQPVKLFYAGPVLPPRAPPGRPLPPVPPDRGRGDRDRLAARRRRGDRPPLRPPRRARRARGRAPAGKPRLARIPPRVPRGAQGPPARQRGRALEGRPRADRDQPAARVRRRRRGDAGRDERARRRSSRASRGRTPSTSPRSAPCSTPPASPTRSTRPWSAASTTTRGRSSPSSARASAPSPRSAAAAATTA